MSECSEFMSDGEAEFLLIGDSHLMTIGLQLQNKLKGLGYSSYALSYSGCIPIAGLFRADKDKSHQCKDYNEKMRVFAQAAGTKTIIMVARFPAYLHRRLYDNGEGGIEHGSPFLFEISNTGYLNQNVSTSDIKLDIIEHVRNDLLSLSENFNLIVFSPTPEAGWDVPSYVSKLVNFRDIAFVDDDNFTHSYDGYLARTKIFTDLVSSIRNNNINYYDFSPLLCSNVNRHCDMLRNGRFLYFDDDHLTEYAADIIATDFEGWLENR